MENTLVDTLRLEVVEYECPCIDDIDDRRHKVIESRKTTALSAKNYSMKL